MDLQPPTTRTISPAHRRRAMVFLILAVAAVGFAMTAQMGLDNNYVVEELGVTGKQRGTRLGRAAVADNCRRNA